MPEYAVRVFARLRERAGSEVVTVSLPAGATVAALRAEVARQWPDAQSLVGRSAVAVNENYASEDLVICPTDDVALIPPVSGGLAELAWCD